MRASNSAKPKDTFMRDLKGFKLNSMVNFSNKAFGEMLPAGMKKSGTAPGSQRVKLLGT